MKDVGPIELVYSVVGNVLDSVQEATHMLKVSDFFETVRWKEPFISAIIGMQLFLFMITYMTRRNDNVQFFILFCVTIIALAAERLNDYGRANWRQFASQNYFDEAGLFMLAFVCGPFIILANFIVIGMCSRLVKMYAKRKRREAMMQRHNQNSDTSVQTTETASSDPIGDKKND